MSDPTSVELPLAAHERGADDPTKLLLAINNAVVSKLELKDLVEAISGCVQDVVAHDFAVLYIYDATVDDDPTPGINAQQPDRRESEG